MMLTASEKVHAYTWAGRRLLPILGKHGYPGKCGNKTGETWGEYVRTDTRPARTRECEAAQVAECAQVLVLARQQRLAAHSQTLHSR